MIDPTQSRDPREFTGWMKAVPKHNLSRLLECQGMRAADLERMTNISNVSAMIDGKRRMSNAILLKCAAALGVSPLFLLDLTEDELPSPQKVSQLVGDVASRRHELESLIYDILTDSSGIGGTVATRTHWSGDTARDPQVVYETDLLTLEVKNPHPLYTRIEVASRIKGIEGDYRDLTALSCNLLETYPQTSTLLLAFAPFSL